MRVADFAEGDVFPSSSQLYGKFNLMFGDIYIYICMYYMEI